ncbi:MAG TPA: glycerate kinase [Tepidisphaeraceae bacterium]|nr:glycerate kinase [Tepidisphaeraceae bacterium]
MKVVIAPDKLKDALNAPEVADAIAAGVRDAMPDATIDCCPISDGGGGFVDAMIAAIGGQRVMRRVTGPLPEMRVEATFGVLNTTPKTAVIEMSSASGIALLPVAERNPLYTTTFGAGELIRAAVEMGCRRIILGIGGSATCDAGIGCAQACGLPVLMDDGETVHDSEPLCGRDVERVRLVKHGRGSVVEGVEFVVASDVTNPLYGANGSARVFGPQKGASPDEVDRLDAALEQLARRQNALDLAHTPGAGAAGGLGFGMMAFFRATLTPGAAMVIDATRLRDRLAGAHLCFTAEGCVDATSAGGKATGAVARLCAELGVPCVVLAGAVNDAAVLEGAGATACLGIADRPMQLAESLARSAVLLRQTAGAVMRIRAAAR